MHREDAVAYSVRRRNYPPPLYNPNRLNERFIADMPIENTFGNQNSTALNTTGKFFLATIQLSNILKISFKRFVLFTFGKLIGNICF